MVGFFNWLVMLEAALSFACCVGCSSGGLGVNRIEWQLFNSELQSAQLVACLCILT